MELTVETAAPVRPWRIDGCCALLFLVLGFSLCMQVFSSNENGARPQIEDEFVYLFQAKTLAAGRLSYPSPPLPEFFEAAHILVVPRFAAKYLPGHALVLAPFVAAGVAWIAPCLLLGTTAALLFLAARLGGLSRPAAIGAGALLLLSGDVSRFFATYLSQSTSLAVVAALFVAALAAERKPSPSRIAALSACASFAVLVRPFTGAAALVICGAVLVRLRRRVPLRRLGWALPPLAAGAIVAMVTFQATTGSWATPPWSLYARQYMPYDGPGIGAVHAPPAERGLPVHLQGLHDRFLESRQRYTWARLPRAALRRLDLVAEMAPTWVLIPFAIAGLWWTSLWSAWLFALVYFALALTFHVGGEIYHLEIYLALSLAVCAGAETAVRRVLRLPGRLAHAGVVALSLAAVYVAVPVATEMQAILQRAAHRGWAYARWEPAFQWFREQRALVFVRYPAGWNVNLDLGYNEPDLSRANVVRAIDLGARNPELLPYFPDRPAFVFDPVSSRVERIR